MFLSTCARIQEGGTGHGSNFAGMFACVQRTMEERREGVRLDGNIAASGFSRTLIFTVKGWKKESGSRMHVTASLQRHLSESRSYSLFFSMATNGQ